MFLQLTSLTTFHYHLHSSIPIQENNLLPNSVFHLLPAATMNLKTQGIADGLKGSGQHLGAGVES